MHRFTAAIALVLLPILVNSATPSNSRIAELKTADQADRSPGGATLNVSLRDAERRAEIRSLLSQGLVRSASDYLDAALILQHGETPEDHQLAYALATISLEIEPTRRARFLVAATWDRILWRRNKPQWYATNYVREGDKWVLWTVDEAAITEEERERMSGRTLEESKALAEKMNREASTR